MPEDPVETVRVRIGADATSPPELLATLAADPSLLVRAAVALNPSAPTEADQTLAQDTNERIRALLGRKLAGFVSRLPVAEEPALREAAIATLTRLIADEAVRVREAIADVVKDLPGAPRALIMRLALDAEIRVSEPVIRLSPVLRPDDLLALMSESPNAVTASLVARRPGLSEAVSDVIASSADTLAIRILLRNRSAAIREATLDHLIARAAEHEDWHEPLVSRPTLSISAARTLSAMVTQQLLQVLADRADLDPVVTQELRLRLQQRLRLAANARAGALRATSPTAAETIAAAAVLAEDNKLDEAELVSALHRGEARVAAALLAVAAHVPLSVIDRATALRSAKGLVSLAWKAGFTMAAATPLQTQLARLPPNDVLAPGAGGGFPLSPEEMTWQLDFLGQNAR